MNEAERQRMIYYYSILDLCGGNVLALTPEERDDYMALVKKQQAESEEKAKENKENP